MLDYMSKQNDFNKIIVMKHLHVGKVVGCDFDMTMPQVSITTKNITIW